jgi:phage gpG-like protein
MNLTIQVNDAAVQAALRQLGERMGDAGPALRDIGEDIVQRTKARFGTGTGPGGERWQAKRVPDGRPTLVGPTGNLRRQIVWSVSGSTLTVQATMAYAAIHQFGGSIQRPARRVEVRHRTDARGELLRRKGLMNDRALVFAKASHKRVRTRWFDAPAYEVKMPARPFLPLRADGTLYPAEQRELLEALARWIDPGAA